MISAQQLVVVVSQKNSTAKLLVHYSSCSQPDLVLRLCFFPDTRRIYFPSTTENYLSFLCCRYTQSKRCKGECQKIGSSRSELFVSRVILSTYTALSFLVLPIITCIETCSCLYYVTKMALCVCVCLYAPGRQSRSSLLE